MKFGQKPYLTSFNKAITKVILNLRLNMLEIRDNFKNSGTENVCPMCLDEKDSTEHLLVCALYGDVVMEGSVENMMGNEDNEHLKQVAIMVENRMKTRGILIRV